MKCVKLQKKGNSFLVWFIFICSCIIAHYLFFQIHWPSTALKTEECIMKGKDAVSIIHYKLSKSAIISLTNHKRLTS